ncbi:MAG: translation initiation factor IF-2 [Verrucomicrobia bacterium]|jgi:translation initiation factor IF-2|nr:translation initiation factor IF-2 [Verrucomicrobiota bacterium]
MPVRIYDIAKKLGIESKAVIAKAKELGIAAAKVPSSSLDKITAEYLEQQIGGPLAAAPTPLAAKIEPEPIIILTPPPVEEEPPAPPPPAQVETEAPVQPAEHPAPAPETAAVEAQMPAIAPEPEVVAPAAQDAPSPEAFQESPPDAEVPQAEETSPEEAVAPEADAPPAPRTPKIGEKVGFIKLPAKPTPKPPVERPAPKAPVRPAPRFDNNNNNNNRGRQGRSFQQGGGRQGGPGQNRGGNTGRNDNRPPVEPKFVPPTTGEMITMKPPIIVRDLAEQLKKKPFQLIADLMQLNVFANVNQAIEENIAQQLCANYGFRFEVEKRERGGGVVHAPIKKVEIDIDDKPEDLKPRAPVVTIMGHVDHGKTTLLDVIRKSDVASGETGGITQHIGAYTITIPHPERKKDLQQITFLDTPGHAAFSSMRARGANVTDIVILVVAANDGVMPQTLEALSHAKAAGVPIIVAVNKCDHPHANPMRVRQQLQEQGLVPDDWGGDTIFQDVSALTKQGLDKLLEMIILQADLLELKANPNRRAKGNVIESGLEPGGPTATVLVRKGTFSVGDTVICGQHWGRVRALINEEGKRLKQAGPSVAVKLLGLNGVPEAGIEFSVVENEKIAKVLTEEQALFNKSQEKDRRPKVTLENLFDTLASESAKVLKVVVKADTQGSVEAIVEAIQKIDTSKVAMEVIHSAVGTVSESDVVLASASKAIVLGFHTRIDNGVSDFAKREGVQIKLYAIIYELIDQVREAMAGLLDPLLKEVVIGAAEVRKIFTLSKGGNVAGCVIAQGRLVKGKMRVMRKKNLIYEGVSLSLRRFQDEVNEVRSGMECGIRLDGFDDYQLGDSIECYTLEKVAQKL